MSASNFLSLVIMLYSHCFATVTSCDELPLYAMVHFYLQTCKNDHVIPGVLYIIYKDDKKSSKPKDDVLLVGRLFCLIMACRSSFFFFVFFLPASTGSAGDLDVSEDILERDGLPRILSPAVVDPGSTVWCLQVWHVDWIVLRHRFAIAFFFLC